jgi:hypothetical protein
VATADRNSAADEMRKLRPFWRDGRIIQWPARESRRRLMLAEVVRAFPPGKRLAEATTASCGGRSSSASC